MAERFAAIKLTNKRIYENVIRFIMCVTHVTRIRMHLWSSACVSLVCVLCILRIVTFAYIHAHSIGVSVVTKLDTFALLSMGNVVCARVSRICDLYNSMCAS